MRTYRRNYEGRLYFFTVVTHERRPILTTDLGRASLRLAIRHVRERHPFRIEAIVLLPDHVHTLWELPRSDVDYSTRWRLIKSAFSRHWCEGNGVEGLRTQSRRRSGERAVWQRRFYEHTCRDDDDVQRCLDYIHVNPLRHRLVERVCEWPWSSFHRYVRLGMYSEDWGSADIWFGDEFRNAE